MAARVAQSGIKRWLGDAGTYPVIATMAIAASLCTYQCTRYLTGHPDVAWNKEKRMSTIGRHDSEYGKSWQSHRSWFMNLQENAVNRNNNATRS